MKAYLKLMIFAFVGILLPAMSAAQGNNTTLDSLMRYEWKLQLINDSSVYIMKFTPDEQIATYYSKNGPIPIIYPYYLSDSKVDQQFDWTKVGKVTSGRFIVFYNAKTSEFRHLKILRMTDDYLELKHVENSAISKYRPVE